MDKKPLGFKEYTNTEEEISFARRRALARQMKKYKSKIKIGREKAKRKTATLPKLKQRATKHVRNMFFQKFSKGKTRDEVPFQRRAEIEKRISKIPKARMDSLVKRMIPKIRKLEMDRKRKG